jgi:hypothetical protein
MGRVKNNTKHKDGSVAITIITGLIILVIIITVITISGGVFIGIGYIFSLIFSLSLFQSTLLCIGASFVAVFTIHSIVNYDDKKKLKYRIYDDDDEDSEEDDYYDDDEEEEGEDIEDEPKKDFTVKKAKKVGRNENCPCGSGKKYKYCCGK